jgi:GAF domain-containing protein
MTLQFDGLENRQELDDINEPALDLLRDLQDNGSSILSHKSTDEKDFAESIDKEIEFLESAASDFSVRFHDENVLNEEELKQLYISHPENMFEDVEQIKDPLEDLHLTEDSILNTKKQIINNALKVVCEKLNFQSAAIFLFSKDGVLERFGIYGWAIDGKRIDSESFLKREVYYQNGLTESSIASGSSSYGKIKYYPVIEKEPFNKNSHKEYLETFGKLRSAIDIPLNGRNKTYGVLRVINKVKLNEKKEHVFLDEPFSIASVQKLLYFSTCISIALSNFRRDVHSQMFKYLSRLLIGYSSESEPCRKQLFRKVVELLVYNPETPFKAAILRETTEEPPIFKLQAHAFYPEAIAKGRNDSDKNPLEAPIWMIVGKGKRLIIQDLQKSTLLDQFKNKDWIKENGFPSFGCFPLVEKGDVVGTLSVYTGHNYQFHPDSVAFLQSISNLLALFIFKVKQEDMERKLGQETIKTGIGSNTSLPRLFYLNGKVEERFLKLASVWEEETAALDLFKRVVHPTYQKIIGLGYPVVPVLLKDLARNRNNPNHWFWALEAIVDENPVKPKHRGYMPKMVDDWVDWGIEKGIISQDN